jgi:uncharacterized protein YcbX
MLDDPQTLQSISQTIPQIGILEAIYARPARYMPCIGLQQSAAVKDIGLQEDRRYLEFISSNQSTVKISNRQVTLIQAEHIEVIAKLMRLAELDASLLRRNLVVSGINLLAIKPLFKHQQHVLQIGEVMLEITGHCTPCSRMEKVLGPGGYNAMRGHGGVNAKVINGGLLKVGDAVKLRDLTQQQSWAF